MTENIWKSITGKKNENPECLIKCEKCKQECIFHINYIEKGLAKCTRKGCFKVELVANELCKLRNWTYKEIDRSYKGHPKIIFTCDKKHLMKMKYESLRLGCNCKKCSNEENERLNTDCDCEVLGIGIRNGHSYAWICEHYNHAIKFPDSASEWDYENPLNNKISPDKVEPTSSKKYWFRCGLCNISYEQSLNHRSRGQRCYYCFGKQISIKDSLATTHPELCKEWDPENEITPYQVSYGSNIYVSWICHKHKNDGQQIIFRWRTAISIRTINKCGCPSCNRQNYDQEIGGHDYFVKIAREIHGNFYEYPEEYKGIFVKISIECPIHGIFQQSPNQHKRGHGCAACNKPGYEQEIGGNDYFLKIAREVHGNFYEYISEYKDAKTKIKIKCPLHGIFEQRPDHHKNGHGCMTCSISSKESKGIKLIKENLEELKIDYEQERIFSGLEYKRELRIDIFIKQFNLCIEYDGQQHFKIINSWGGEQAFIENQLRDIIKDKFCIDNGLNLLRIPYNVIPTKELILFVINECKERQMYISYEHYRNRVIDYLVDTKIDLSKIIACNSLSPSNMDIINKDIV